MSAEARHSNTRTRRGTGAKKRDRDTLTPVSSQSFISTGFTNQLEGVGTKANQRSTRIEWVGSLENKVLVGLDPQLERPTGPTVGIGWLITHPEVEKVVFDLGRVLNRLRHIVPVSKEGWEMISL